MYRRKNIILGVDKSPNRKKLKKPPKHTILEFGLDRIFVSVAILSVLHSFSPLSFKQLVEMIHRKLQEEVARTKIRNLVNTLWLWGYVKKSWRPTRYRITEKGEMVLKKSEAYLRGRVDLLFSKELPPFHSST